MLLLQERQAELDDRKLEGEENTEKMKKEEVGEEVEIEEDESRKIERVR